MMNDNADPPANAQPPCEQIRQELVAMLYGELPEVQRATVQAHLDACPECRREWRDLQKTAAQLDAWTPPNLLRSSSTESPRTSRPRRGWLRSAAIGGLAAAVAFGALALLGAEARLEDGRFVLAIGKPAADPQPPVNPDLLLVQARRSAQAEMDRRIGLLIEAIRDEFSDFQTRQAREQVHLVRYVDLQRDQFASEMDRLLRQILDEVVEDSRRQGAAIEQLFALNAKDTDEPQSEEYEQ